MFIYCYYFYNILGFVCNRKDLSASGCCHSGGESTHRYECTDCQSNNCCSIYEHCVSCCLSPDNVSSKKWFTEYIHANKGCIPLGWSRSGSVICDHSDHGRSNEPMNPLWTRIHRFIWSTMIQVISEHWYWWGTSQRNRPKDEHNSFTCNLFFARKWYITWPFISIFLQKNLLEQILKLGSSVPNIISKSVKDQFELCLVKCRTSSKVTKLIYIYKLRDYLHCIYM